MRTKKPKAIKPVKAFALYNPVGEYLGCRLVEEEIWILAFDAYRSCNDRPRMTFSQVKSLVKKKGYHAIPVLITPIVK